MRSALSGKSCQCAAQGQSQRWSRKPPAAETLAEMIGTNRSRVNYFMNKFRRLGMIDYRGRMGDKPTVRPLLATILSEASSRWRCHRGRPERHRGRDEAVSRPFTEPAMNRA
jgi:hypothetical protein